MATLLADAEPGAIEVLGEGEVKTVTLVDSISRGHKSAHVALSEGDLLIKYSIVIGYATRAIDCGEHVHLHNCRSEFDSRSSTLSVDDGTPEDTPYE